MAAVPTIGRAYGIEPKVAAPEADATRSLYESYSRQIYNYCLHQLSSREEAEDAVQTTFMNAFRGLKRGVVPEAEQAWLFKIAENVCLSRRRSSWRRGRVESPNDFEVLQEIVPSKHASRADELIGLEDALEAMPENQRRAILLREWQGLSYREIADELELSQAAVETLIFRARRSLAAGLEQPAPAKKRRLRGAAQGLNLGSLLAGLKSLLTGGAAVKAVVVAVAATATVAAGTKAEPVVARHLHGMRPAPAAPAAVVTDESRATFSPTANVVAAATGRTVADAHRATHPVSLRAGAVAEARVTAPSATAAAVPPAAAAPAPTAAETPVAPPAAPQVSAPEQPKADEPKAETPRTETPRTETPRTETPKGDDNNGKSENAGKKADEAKPAAPATSPAPKNDNGNGNDKKADEPKAATPAVPAAPATQGNGNGNGNGNANGNDKNEKKADEPKAAAAAPVPPAVEDKTSNGNGNGASANNGNGNDKKAAVAAPAPPAVTAPAAPPVPPTNPPQHGNGNGNADKDKGKK